MDEILITLMTEEDLKYIPSLYKEYGNRNTDVDKMYKEYTRLKNNKDYLFVVAKKGIEVVGFASLVINHDIVEKTKPFMTIWNVRVKEIYRRNKIGMKMFNFIEMKAKELNCDFIALLTGKDNKIAQEFYKSCGYYEEYGYIRKV
ncbi:MAG TPA: GNAT family N-acetyltransferase [Bacilli bacterium]|nr:GNAT family N-acetyltransferase [Bacilli bacterium]